jgi:hypothetical protein
VRYAFPSALAAAVALFTGIAVADDGLGVTFSCESKSSRGRVLCEVEIEAVRGRLAWADAVVLSAPDFAPPLKTRVGPQDEKARSDRRVRLPIAFLAKTEGSGTVTIRARAVLCAQGGGEACVTATRTASAELRAGPLVP